MRFASDRAVISAKYNEIHGKCAVELRTLVIKV
jgi:hypothetical protein